VALQVAADDGTIDDVEDREQCRRVMTLVVVGHRPGSALLHGQAGSSAWIWLFLFIDQEDDGMGGWIDIEADDIAQFIDKARLGGQLKLFLPGAVQAARALASLSELATGVAHQNT
jgi:hypothetical protein